MLKADKLKNDQEKEIAAIRDRYADQLLDLNHFVDVGVSLLDAWAVKNANLFAVKKSLDLTHAVIGFRTGMPKLKLKSKQTWEKVLGVLRMDFSSAFVRTEASVDKAGLLADRDNLKTQYLMERVGIKVVQDETFFVEHRREAEVEAEKGAQSK